MKKQMIIMSSVQYVEKMKELTRKGMILAAITLFEDHRDSLQEDQHIILYVNLLLAAGFTSKAATVFLQTKESLSSDQRFAIEECFAALLLSSLANVKEFSALFTEDALLIKHLGIVNQALKALSQGALDEVEGVLVVISFRSPYKQVRLLLKGCLLLVKNQLEEAQAILQHIPNTSPFYNLSVTAKLLVLPHLELLKVLPSLSQVAFNFLSILKGWSPHQQKHIDKVRRLYENSKPKVLFDLIIMSLAYTNKLSAKRLAYSLLPWCMPALKIFENKFGILDANEKAHLKALHAITKREIFPAYVWLEYEKSLGSSLPFQQRDVKRALALRHAVDFVMSNSCEPNPTLDPDSVEVLEQSLGLDPACKITSLALITYYKEQGPKKNAQQWIDQALEVFPNDRQILETAIDFSRQSKSVKSIDYSLNLTRKILELDPINLVASQCLTEFQLVKVQRLLIKKHWEQAEALLIEIQDKASNFWDLPIQFNFGLCQYVKGDFFEARLLLEPCVQNNILGTIQLCIEAQKLKISVAQLAHDLIITSSNKLKINNSAELLDVLKIIEISSKDSSITKVKELFKYIEKALNQAVNCCLTIDELTIACRILDGFRSFDLVIKFILQFLKSPKRELRCFPILSYYYVHAQIKGQVTRVSEDEYDILIDVFNRAQKNKDFLAASLTEQLLNKIDAKEEEKNEMNLILEDMPDTSDIPDVSEEFMGKMMKMFKKLTKKIGA